jgi:hypothetical protein
MRFVRGFFAFHTLDRESASKLADVVRAFRDDAQGGELQQALDTLDWPFIEQHYTATAYALGFEHMIALLARAKERNPQHANAMNGAIKKLLENYCGVDLSAFSPEREPAEFSAMLQNFARLLSTAHSSMPKSLVGLIQGDITSAIMREGRAGQDIDEGAELARRLAGLGYPGWLVSDTVSAKYDLIAGELGNRKSKQFLSALLEAEVAQNRALAISRLEEVWLPLIETAVQFSFIPLKEPARYADGLAAGEEEFDINTEVQGLFRGSSELFHDGVTSNLLTQYAQLQVNNDRMSLGPKEEELREILMQRMMQKVSRSLVISMKDKFNQAVIDTFTFLISRRLLNHGTYKEFRQKMLAACDKRGQDVNSLYNDCVVMIGQNRAGELDHALWLLAEDPESFQERIGDEAYEQLCGRLRALRA